MSELVSPGDGLALSEMLDRVLNKGVVIYGDLTISIAGVDLIYVGLKVLASSVETAARLGCGPLDRALPAHACRNLAQTQRRLDVFARRQEREEVKGLKHKAETSAADARQFPIRQSADVASGVHPIGRYLLSLPFAARVNDWFFAHAGNTGGAGLATLEAGLRSGVESQGFGAPVLSDADSILEYSLDTAGPWWELPGYDPVAVLAEWTAAVNAAHIVQGHEPGNVRFSDGTERTRGKLFQKFGLVFLIDAGMSRGVDYSAGAVLHIHRSTSTGKTTVTVVYPSGATSGLWSD